MMETVNTLRDLIPGSAVSQQRHSSLCMPTTADSQTARNLTRLKTFKDVKKAIWVLNYNKQIESHPEMLHEQTLRGKTERFLMRLPLWGHIRNMAALLVSAGRAGGLLPV